MLGPVLIVFFTWLVFVVFIRGEGACVVAHMWSSEGHSFHCIVQNDQTPFVGIGTKLHAVSSGFEFARQDLIL